MPSAINTPAEQQLRACLPRHSATFAPRHLRSVSLVTLPLILLTGIALFKLGQALLANPAQTFKNISIDQLLPVAFLLLAILECIHYLQHATLLRYNAQQDTFSQRKILRHWQTPLKAAAFSAIALQESRNTWRVILLGHTPLTVYQISNTFSGNRKIARQLAERIARASALPFILHPCEESDDTFIYRQTAAAQPADPRRPVWPPGIFAEAALIAATVLILHLSLPALRGWHSAWLLLILPLGYLLLRSLWWQQQDKNRHFFPSLSQQSAFIYLIAFTIITCIPLYFSLTTLFTAAGGQSAHYLLALLTGGITLIPFTLARHEWRALRQPLLSYQADNQTFVIYRWQDYRHVADKTWPVDNFQGIALRALPTERWQLLLLGKNGQNDILLEEGQEKPLRQRQKILAQSSGMAMLEA